MDLLAEDNSAGQLPVLDLPTDRPRQPIQTHRGGSHDFHLNDELSGRLKALAKAQGATLYVVMLAAFQAMLHYLYAGRTTWSWARR